MGELDDLDAAGTGTSGPAGDGGDDDDPEGARLVEGLADDAARRRCRFEVMDRTLERLDVLDALDDLQRGGAGGLATGVEIFGEQLAHGPYDDLLDAFEPVRDLADHTDLFDDLF